MAALHKLSVDKHTCKPINQLHISHKSMYPKWFLALNVVLDCFRWSEDLFAGNSLSIQISEGSAVMYIHSEPEKTWQYIFDYNFG